MRWRRRRPIQATPGSCLAMLAASALTLIVLLWLLVWPQWRANQVYVEHSCMVRDKRLVESRHKGATQYRPELLIDYTVAGREYHTWAYSAVHARSSWKSTHQAVLDRFVVGQIYPCYVDPDDPEQVVLVRGGYYWMTWVLVPAMALAMAGSLVGFMRTRRHQEAGQVRPS